MINSNYLMDHMLYQIIKKHNVLLNNNLSAKIYINKTDNRIVFKIKTGS